MACYEAVELRTGNNGNLPLDFSQVISEVDTVVFDIDEVRIMNGEGYCRELVRLTFFSTIVFVAFSLFSLTETSEDPGKTEECLQEEAQEYEKVRELQV